MDHDTTIRDWLAHHGGIDLHYDEHPRLRHKSAVPLWRQFMIDLDNHLPIRYDLVLIGILFGFLFGILILLAGFFLRGAL
jgi:hypothetical protein